jgi:hypothetical protein
MVLRKKLYVKVFALIAFLSVYSHQGFSQSPAVVQSADFSYSLKLISLSFSGDGIVPIIDDNFSRFYDAPHWIPTEQKPVCYVSGSKPKVACKFRIDGQCNSAIYVKGICSNGMNFIPKPLNVNQDGTAVYPLTEANTEFQLGKIDFFNPFSITWSISASSSGPWAEIMISENKLYVTKNTPKRITSTGPLRMKDVAPYNLSSDDRHFATVHTILQIGCKYGKDKNTDEEIVKNIYSYFITRRVLSVENQIAMQYWGNQVGNGIRGPISDWAFSPLGLLKYGDGRCQAWAYLFLEIMRTQGINGVTLQSIQWKNNENLDETAANALTSDLSTSDLVVNTSIIKTNLKAYFFIKNWGESADRFVLGNSNYYPELQVAEGDLNGLGGQNTVNPWSAFYNHLLVEYNGTIYDPSYGSTPSSSTQGWQDNNVAYLGTEIRARQREVRNSPLQKYFWLKPINLSDIINKKLEPYQYPY